MKVAAVALCITALVGCPTPAPSSDAACADASDCAAGEECIVANGIAACVDRGGEGEGEHIQVVVTSIPLAAPVGVPFEVRIINVTGVNDCVLSLDGVDTEAA